MLSRRNAPSPGEGLSYPTTFNLGQDDSVEQNSRISVNSLRLVFSFSVLGWSGLLPFWPAAFSFGFASLLILVRVSCKLIA